MTDDQLSILLKQHFAATPAPWSWAHIGEKTNGYCIGVAYNENGEQLSGRVHYDDISETLIEKCVYVGSHEASTVNYVDADLMVNLRNNLFELLIENQDYRSLGFRVVDGSGKLIASFSTMEDAVSFCEKQSYHCSVVDRNADIVRLFSNEKNVSSNRSENVFNSWPEWKRKMSERILRKSE